MPWSSSEEKAQKATLLRLRRRCQFCRRWRRERQFAAGQIQRCCDRDMTHVQCAAQRQIKTMVQTMRVVECRHLRFEQARSDAALSPSLLPALTVALFSDCFPCFVLCTLFTGDQYFCAASLGACAVHGTCVRATSITR